MDIVVARQRKSDLKTIQHLLNTNDPIDQQILALMNANKLNVDIIDLDI